MSGGLGLVAVDVTGFETATASTPRLGTFLAYVPAVPAHGPDESLHLGVFRKAIAANVHLLAELGALGKNGLR